MTIACSHVQAHNAMYTVGKNDKTRGYVVTPKSTKVQTLGANIWACARAQTFENAHALTTMCEYTEGRGAKTETRTAVYNVD